MSSSRKTVSVMSAAAKQIARSVKHRNVKKTNREARLAGVMQVTLVKLSGLEIMRTRKAAAKSTLPTMRRVRMYWAFVDRVQPKDPSKK